VCVATSTASADRVDVDVEGVECMMITVMVMAMWADPSPFERSTGAKGSAGSHESGIRLSSSSPPPLSSFPSDPNTVYSPPHPTPFSYSPFRSTVRAALLCSALLLSRCLDGGCYDLRVNRLLYSSHEGVPSFSAASLASLPL
jgi:hypothetical protein